MKRLVMLLIIIFSLSVFSEVTEAKNYPHKYKTSVISHKKTKKIIKKRKKHYAKAHKNENKRANVPECAKKSHRTSDKMY